MKKKGIRPTWANTVIESTILFFLFCLSANVSVLLAVVNFYSTQFVVSCLIYVRDCSLPLDWRFSFLSSRFLFFFFIFIVSSPNQLELHWNFKYSSTVKSLAENTFCHRITSYEYIDRSWIELPIFYQFPSFRRPSNNSATFFDMWKHRVVNVAPFTFLRSSFVLTHAFSLFLPRCPPESTRSKCSIRQGKFQIRSDISGEKNPANSFATNDEWKESKQLPLSTDAVRTIQRILRDRFVAVKCFFFLLSVFLFTRQKWWKWGKKMYRIYITATNTPDPRPDYILNGFAMRLNEPKDVSINVAVNSFYLFFRLWHLQSLCSMIIEMHRRRRRHDTTQQRKTQHTNTYSNGWKVLKRREHSIWPRMTTVNFSFLFFSPFNGASALPPCGEDFFDNPKPVHSAHIAVHYENCKKSR